MKVSFEVSISGRDDGTIEAVYIQLLDQPVARTKEIEEDVLIVDYAKDGQIVGMEILAPVKLGQVTRLVIDKHLRRSFREFVEKSMPRELLCA